MKSHTPKKPKLIHHCHISPTHRKISSPPLSPIQQTLTVKIDCGNGNVARILTKPSDDPVELSQNFCKLYGY